MKNFNEMKMEERREIAELFSNWLKDYTHEVIKVVMLKADDIINNDFAMHLLKELKVREEKEYEDFYDSIGHMISDFETFGEYDPHSHVLEHSNSYRDVLYDMYIKR